LIKKVLLDTSFLIRLMNNKDPLHKNAYEYYNHFLEKEWEMYLSTIVISEYCVKDKIENLPLEHFKIIVFDFEDAKKSGQFFNSLKAKSFSTIKRNVVINDCKLIAQIVNRNIDGYVTNDVKSIEKIINPLKTKFKFNIEIITLNQSLKEYEGRLL